MADLIEPRTLKGFRDFLPPAMRIRQAIMRMAIDVYERYGYQPIDTPVLEYYEVLCGKGSEETDRQMYHFEHGRHHVGMRFDLTVPLARFVAQHHASLPMPFRRYHIAPVWRGENTQAGRYREFYQCDFDTIGTEGVVSDIETILVARDLIIALDLPAATIRVNSRQILTGLLRQVDAVENSTAVLRALDKLEKQGEQAVVDEMQTAGLSTSQIDAVLALGRLEGSPAQRLDSLRATLGNEPTAAEGIDRLQAILDSVAARPSSRVEVTIDVSIARGLDYYTGVVFETLIAGAENFGSICSGGRYNNLAGLYTKQHLPGIGGSLGMDRLIAVLEHLQAAPPSRDQTVFIPYFDSGRLADYLELAANLRRSGVACEVYPEPKKLGPQLKYADARGLPLAIIAGSDELDRDVVQLKDLRHKRTEEIAFRPDCASLIDRIQALLRLPDGALLA